MNKARMEAFSDGVIAILITIMVLELKVPHDADVGAIRPLLPVFLTYVLSFVNLGIYWNNHHHLLHTVQRTSGGIVGELASPVLALVGSVHDRVDGRKSCRPLPTALYGVVLLMFGVAYTILTFCIIATHGQDSKLAVAVGGDAKEALRRTVRARDPARVRERVDFCRDLRDRGGHLVHSDPRIERTLE
ncbi:MAG: TMEM175 family protein [Gemmatimonadaceae bacterium]